MEKNWDSIERRFWAKVDKRGPDECWPWMGSKTEGGYGQMSVESYGSPEKAHRIAWMLAHGRTEIPDGVEIRHTCDFPSCANPAHTIEGTHMDNVRDRESRGRHGRTSKPKTEWLTSVDVLAICEEYQSGCTRPELASKYDVSPQTIWRVVSGKTHKHITAGQSFRRSAVLPGVAGEG